jgi:DNA polymerase III subunit epsilon
MLSWLTNLRSRREIPAPFSPKAGLDGLRYVVVDTELTSLDSASNRILSVGAMVMEGNRVRMGEQFYRVVNPGVSVPADTIVIHGLRPVDVAQGVAPAQAVQEFLSFAKGAVIVGHFVGIDLAALRKELPQMSDGLSVPALDTARIQRWLDQRRAAHNEDRGHDVEKVDLASLAGRYGLEVHDVHHALYDAFLTAQLWQRLMHALALAGVKKLGQAMRVGKAERMKRNAFE